ncbi:MAG: hypothetical protein MR681_02620 [Prevotella sp.]|nr:hypothetical protein [Prevotella sp.]
MKKKLFSICALAMSLTTSAQIVETPAGTLHDNMYRSSESWVSSWTGGKEGVYEGLVSKIVEGTDGCLYVYNPISGYDSQSWMKLDKVGEGKYTAKFPQLFAKDDNGGDDESADGAERLLSLNRLKMKDGGYEVVAETENSFDFTWDGEVLKMEGVGSNDEILGVTVNGKYLSNYGDWAVTVKKLMSNLVTPPANVTTRQYSMTCKGQSTPRILDVAISGDEIYVKGLSKNKRLANSWVKFTTDGNKATFLTNQYLGVSGLSDFGGWSVNPLGFHVFAAAFESYDNKAEKIEFTVDPETGKIATDKLIVIMIGITDDVDGMKEFFDSMELTPFEQKAATPATPELYYCSAVESYDYTYTTTTMAFYVNNVDVDGNYLNPENMYYNAYLNDDTEPFEFTRSEYYDLEENITNIPFNFKDKRNNDIKAIDNQRILHFYGPSIAKVRIVMVYEADGKKFESEPLVASVVSSGIDSPAEGNLSPVKIYSLDGCKMKSLQKGLNIVKEADGKIRKIFLKK